MQDAIDSMYQATYYNSPKDKKDLEGLTDKINQHINSITNYNMNSTGVPSTSRLYSRLRMATSKSPDGQKDMTELFDNAIGFEDFYSNFMQNRYLVEVDAEIDSVCKYFPELVEALEVKKEGVLSADHFSKDYLTVKNKAITEDNTEFNDEIDTLKDKYKLLVGERTAEEIKITIGTVFPGNRNEKMEVRGRDLVTGLPHTITLSSEEVEEGLRESVYTIIHAAKGILEQTPPELSADIIDKGIVLTGGGSLVDGFNQILAHELKVPVFTAESPLTCVAEGTGVMLDNIHMIDR